MWRSLALAGACTLAALGCGDECLDGAERLCPCAGGAVGIDVCSGGAFGGCDCSAARPRTRAGEPDPPPPPRCGDSFCDGEETPATCEIDCGASCGDDVCAFIESPRTCPADCPGTCGDGYCIRPAESLETCRADCRDSSCNDICEAADTCPDDCPDCEPLDGSRVGLLTERGLDLGPPAMVVAGTEPYVAWAQRPGPETTTPYSVVVASLTRPELPPTVLPADVHPEHPRIALARTATELAVAWLDPSGTVVVHGVAFDGTPLARHAVVAGVRWPPAMTDRDGTVFRIASAREGEIRIDEVDIEHDTVVAIASVPAGPAGRPALHHRPAENATALAWIEGTPDASTGWLHLLRVELGGTFGTPVILGTARAGTTPLVVPTARGWRVSYWSTGGAVEWRDYSPTIDARFGGRIDDAMFTGDPTLTGVFEHTFRSESGVIVGYVVDPERAFGRSVGPVLARAGSQQFPAAIHTGLLGYAVAFVDFDGTSSAIAWVGGVCAPPP